MFGALPIVGRAHEPADQVCSLSGWVNGIVSDETVGKGLAPSVREAALVQRIDRKNGKIERIRPTFL